jgi:hypothetical protein
VLPLSQKAHMATAQFMLVGGPTAVIEVGGYRLLTDPTFDPPSDYELSYTRLRKFGRPAGDGDKSDPSMPCCSVTTSISTISIVPAEPFCGGRREF